MSEKSSRIGSPTCGAASTPELRPLNGAAFLRRKAVYEAFDSFLKVDTWYTRHPLDEARFFQCLNTVVRDAEFNPERMGEYMRQKTGRGFPRQDHPFTEQIDLYVADARAVKTFLNVTQH